VSACCVCMRDHSRLVFFWRMCANAGLALLLCMVSPQAPATARTEAVIGGADAIAGAFPWQVLLKQNSFFHCGGVLVRPGWVLTAAHCVQNDVGNLDARMLQAVAGDYDRLQPDAPERQTLGVAEIFVHPDYRQPCCFRDLALLRLTAQANATDFVAPIWTLTDTAALTAGLTGVVTGWGMTTPSGPVAAVLQRATMTVSVSTSSSGYFLTEGPSAICYGDSGGPFVIYTAAGPRLAGIASFGGCNPGGGFADVAGAADWIDETILHGSVVIGGPRANRVLLPLVTR
jgi:secreted trypsin-like serine protease